MSGADATARSPRRGLGLPILWITNLQAPYREPVWRSLARTHPLEVAFLSAGSPERPWSYRPRSEYRSRVLRTYELPISDPDQAVYLLMQGAGIRARRYRAVVLGSWESPAYWQALAMAKTWRIPTVAFLEVGPTSSRYGGNHPVARMRRRFFTSVGSVLTSGITATNTALSMGVPPSRIVTGFNSVDGRAIREVAEGVRSSSTSRQHDGHQFVYVGRLLRRKNVPAVVRAFAAVAGPEDRLLVIGDGPERPEVEVTLRYQKPDLRGRITMLSARPSQEVFSLLASSQTLVLASSAETWGLVVNEALAAGIHVVVTKSIGSAASVAGMRGVYVADDAETGLVAAMAASRRDWTGPIAEPEILRHGPEQAAADALAAVGLAEKLASGEARE